MKHEMSHGPDADLSRVLREWRLAEPLPAGFNRAVWRRVAVLSEGRVISPVRRMRDWLAGRFVRPAWSIGYAVLLLGAGLLAGYWQATSQTARWDDQMAKRYVQSVDPYLRVAVQP